MCAFKGSFVPTTYIWDVAQLEDIDVNSPEFRELLVRLYQNLNEVALNLNLRDTGYYTSEEFINGQLFLRDPSLVNDPNSTGLPSDLYRAVTRKVIIFGALPNAAEKSLPHGINVTPTTIFTRIYGTANDLTGTNYIPLPFASPVLADNIQVRVDATNVSVRTGSNRTNFTHSYIVLEWIVI